MGLFLFIELQNNCKKSPNYRIKVCLCVTYFAIFMYYTLTKKIISFSSLILYKI